MSKPKSKSAQRVLWRIDAWGAVTSIGTSAWQSAASWVGGQRRFRKAVHADIGPLAITSALCPEITKESTGVEQLAALTAGALQDLAATLPRGTTLHPADTLVLAALPLGLDSETIAAFWHGVTVALPKPLQTLVTPVPTCALGANAAGFVLLKAAHEEAVGDRAIKHVLLIAADSLANSARLSAAYDAGWLLSDKNTEGFIPGEAAGAVLLTRSAVARDTDERRLFIHPATTASAPQRRWPNPAEPAGEATTSVLTASLAAAGMQAEHISHAMCDMDGSNWRASEQSPAKIRTLSVFPPQNWEPAACLGQIGAATVPVYLALAAERAAKDRQAPNTVLLWAIDAGTDCGAVVLERATAPARPAAKREGRRERVGQH